MKKFILVIAPLFILLSCGGSSDGSSGGGERSSIEGNWKGDLYQGVVACADGTAFGACGGCVVATANLVVSGSDVLGSVVNVTDGECVLEGERTTEGFIAYPVSGCNSAISNLEFNLLGQGEAGMSYHYDINKVEAAPGQVACIITPSGTLVRE